MLLEERIEFGNSIARNAIKFIAVAAATRASFCSSGIVMENRTVISSRGYFIIRRVSRGKKREKGRRREETEKRNPCEIISPRAFEQFPRNTKLPCTLLSRART